MPEKNIRKSGADYQLEGRIIDLVITSVLVLDPWWYHDESLLLSSFTESFQCQSLGDA
jgi:hypothetical protein